MWLCDKWARGVAAARVVTPSIVEWHDRNETVLIKLSFADLGGAVYHPGQYFFINIPGVSLNEWHPFTASAVLDDGIVFYIKRRLAMQVQAAGAGKGAGLKKGTLAGRGT